MLWHREGPARRRKRGERVILKIFGRLFHRVLQYYKDISIRRKLLVILNIVILVPLILVGCISYVNSKKIIEEKSIEYSQDVLKTISLHLRDNIATLNILSLNIISDDRIYPIVRTTSADFLTTYEDRYEVNDVMKNIILSVDEIQSICIVSNNGKYFYADSNRSTVGVKDIVPLGSDLLEKIKARAREGSGAPVWYLEMLNSRVNHLFYVRTIYDRDNFQELGVMIILVNKDYFSDMFTTLENADMSDTFLLSQDYDVILSKSREEDSMAFKSVFKGMEGDGWMIDKGRNVLVSYSSLGDPPWKIVSCIPLNLLFGEIYAIRRKIIVACALSVVFISLVSIGISYDFIRAIQKIIRAMKKVQKGERQVAIDVGRKDELGYVSETFNSMVHEITMLEKWIYREQLTRKEAELKSLQAQINPHFLFNTLESVNWMARLENVPKISQTVTALATLMEAGIVRKDKVVPFSRELEYIDSYIQIMKNRYEDNLSLVKEIDPKSLPFQIPKLLIQPLVENAIQHGFENRAGKGIVRIRSEITQEYFEVMVEDNGAGIDAAQLKRLNERLENDDEDFYDGSSGSHHGIGLANVNRRIKLFYGPEYGLKIESKKERFTRVWIRIPVSSRVLRNPAILEELKGHDSI